MAKRNDSTNKIKCVILLVPEALVQDKLVSVASLKKWHIFSVRSDAVQQRHRDAWIFARELFSFSNGVLSKDETVHQWCIFAEYQIGGLICLDLTRVTLPTRTPASIFWVNIRPSDSVTGSYWKKTSYVLARKMAF